MKLLSILRQPRGTDWRIVWNHYLKELASASNWEKKMSEDNVRFDGRVAIVTGAGGGNWICTCKAKIAIEAFNFDYCAKVPN